ncbi:MAG: cbb3-type cytochrome c oxidase subunit I [Bacteroidia bacterium]|nr:cbb3-type cytochrome c oxidase subunit I [Bacteroidia bacterium]MCO5254935.1 cbb3-type cytochrome c oxidase subunit I [Bacteroidota bacterium]
MEQYHSKRDYPVIFIKAGLIFLLSTLLFGLLGAIEYAVPGFWRDIFSFAKIRPLHVSSSIFWILTCAIGGILYYLKEDIGGRLKFEGLIKVIFYILALTFSAILISFIFGIFGGREYWEFNPVFSIPISVGWIIFIIVFVANMKTLKNQPVYIWMWFTGAIFFLLTYLESNSWLLPQVRNNLVKDMTIQWKSYGSLVGAWNQLIYGTSIYLMDKILGNKKYSFSNIAFGLYFLGVFNLMFNWGHHVYLLPTQPYVKHIGYLVSMTELLLFGRIIYLWKSSLSTAKINFHKVAFRFLFAADIWVFLTLALAILMSIPALNVYMHGTHVIVGHTMGATIGINTMLLLAFAYDIIGYKEQDGKMIKYGYRIINYSLLVFWLTLIIAGFLKTYYQFTETDMPYQIMMNHLHNWFYLFLLSGVTMIAGFVLVIIPLLRKKSLKSA